MNCRQELLRRLGLAVSWVRREELVHGLDAGEFVVDNTLADLVVEGLVMFNARGREYRLAGEPVARQALRELLTKPGLQRMAVGMQSQRNPKVYRVGVAQRGQGDTPGFMYEVELPYPGLAGMMELQTLMREMVR